jgi:septum site-determining protein MinD
MELANSQFHITDVYHEHPRIPNLFYFRVSTGDTMVKPDISDVIHMFDELRGIFDYCVIDTPAKADLILEMTHADVSIIVTNEEVSSLKAAARASKLAHDMGVGDIQLLINQIMPKSFRVHWTPVDDLIETIDAKLIGLVLADKHITHAKKENTPLVLYKHKRAVYDLRDAMRRSIGEDVPWRQHLSQAYVSSVSAKKALEKLVGSYGDPDLWAESTLDHETDKLVKIYEIKPSKTVSAETIRNRMWLHDMLDDEGIQYKVDITGYWATRKKFLEAQSIYVEPQNRRKTRELIIAYKDPENIISEKEIAMDFVDGVLQKICPTCSEEIDFDYPKCPHCKSSV